MHSGNTSRRSQRPYSSNIDSVYSTTDDNALHSLIFMCEIGFAIEDLLYPNGNRYFVIKILFSSNRNM